MSDNIVKFRGKPAKPRSSSGEADETLFDRTYVSRGRSMHTFVFRSYDLIVESDEAELLRDVCLDTHKAEVKLRKLKERLQRVREQSAAQIELLTAAETKLSTAIVTALLSGQR
jgi:hypothetical protein